MSKKLINENYYWVKSTRESQWEIARFEEKVRAYRGNDVFFFTDSRYSYSKDCFEIDYESIGRKS